MKHVYEGYRPEFEELQRAFVQMFDVITEIFEENESVTPENLRRLLSFYPDLSPSLANADKIFDIIIQQHSSFTCCSCLEHVASRFRISAAQQEIRRYLEYMENFCSQRLTQHIYMRPFIERTSEINLTPSTTITFRLEWNADEKTLADIQTVLRQAFHKKQIYVHIVVVAGGSVSVVCYAPEHLMNRLASLAKENEKMLIKIGVTYFRVGDTVVVDQSGQPEVK